MLRIAARAFLKRPRGLDQTNLIIDQEDPPGRATRLSQSFRGRAMSALAQAVGVEGRVLCGIVLAVSGLAKLIELEEATRADTQRHILIVFGFLRGD